MWGNALFITKMYETGGDAVVIPSHGREMGHALFRSFVFSLKKRFRDGDLSLPPRPLPSDTLFWGKKCKNYGAACDRVFSGVVRVFFRDKSNNGL